MDRGRMLLVFVLAVASLLLHGCFCQLSFVDDRDIWQYAVQKFGIPPFIKPPHNVRNSSDIPTSVEGHLALVVEWLEAANEATRRLQHIGAVLDWEYNTNLNLANAERLLNYGLWRKAYMKPWRNQAHLFTTDILPPALARQIKFFRRGSNDLPIHKSQEMLKLHHQLQRMYSSGKVCLLNGTCLSGEPDLTSLMESSRDPDQLLWAWTSWRDSVGPYMKQPYFHFIKLQNELARSAGAADMGEAWRREMGDEDFEGTCERLYKSIRPLFNHLHAYVRRKLVLYYGSLQLNLTGPIPAHLLGNMWGQDWSSLMDIVVPYPDHPLVDITPSMNSLNFTPTTMFRFAEDFFMSIGLEPMTDEFWERSVFTKLEDGRDMTCHASATNFFDGKDYRIRLCSHVSMDYLKTIHHEMGHVEYFMQYRHQPAIFQDGANSAFHEAVGDTVQYSYLTPEHLHDAGLLHQLPSTPEEDINFLMKQALMKIPLIPFSLMIDKWRWEMFKQQTDGWEEFRKGANRKWWQLRLKYQGVRAPVDRNDEDFDPGAKFHIPDNTPFIRYFLGSFIQVQFHRALCRAEYGEEAPSIHRCSIYGSKRAGDLLKSVLSLGSSRPWQEAMFMMTGQHQISPDALLEYYRPLFHWLQAENRRNGDAIGW